MADVTQNIGAQLFVKELPPSQKASYYGCQQNDFNNKNMTTCVNYPDSDVAIETAFQKQLNLSEFYKSPYVFETIKTDYMNKTMGNEPVAQVNTSPEVSPPPQVLQQVNTLTGQKEPFGYSSIDPFQIFVILCVIAAVIYVRRKNA